MVAGKRCEFRDDKIINIFETGTFKVHHRTGIHLSTERNGSKLLYQLKVEECPDKTGFIHITASYRRLPGEVAVVNHAVSQLYTLIATGIKIQHVALGGKQRLVVVHHHTLRLAVAIDIGASREDQRLHVVDAAQR